MGGRVARGPRHAVGLEPVGESLIRGARRDPCDVASGRRRVFRSGTSNRNTFASRLFCARSFSRRRRARARAPPSTTRRASSPTSSRLSLCTRQKPLRHARGIFFRFSGHEALVRLRFARRSDAISPVALTARESSSERLGSSHCCAAAGGTYAPPPCPSEGFPSGTP
jgi:hypothetical protein